MTKSVVPTTTGALYAKKLSDLLAEADTEVAVTVERNTIASRKAAFSKAVAELDVETLDRIDKVMASYVPNLATIDADTPRELTHNEIVALAEEYVDYRVSSEFLESRKDSIRSLVFAHLDSVGDPGAPGAVEVPEVGVTFKREGGGRSDPSVDPERLVELLGIDPSEVYDTVHVPEVVIPAHVEATFSEEKLMRLAEGRPEVMEAIRQSLVPGKPRTPRFTVR